MTSQVTHRNDAVWVKVGAATVWSDHRTCPTSEIAEPLTDGRLVRASKLAQRLQNLCLPAPSSTSTNNGLQPSRALLPRTLPVSRQLSMYALIVTREGQWSFTISFVVIKQISLQKSGICWRTTKNTMWLGKLRNGREHYNIRFKMGIVASWR